MLVKTREAVESMANCELDVRQLRKPDKHSTIFTGYAALAVGEAFVLVNNHDPKHLRAEFDVDYPGSYGKGSRGLADPDHQAYRCARVA